MLKTGGIKNAFHSIIGSKQYIYLKKKERGPLCKDAYFSVSLHKELKEYISFIWLGNLSKFLYLRSGLSQAWSIFKKLLKIPVASLSTIDIRLIIYLHDFRVWWEEEKILVEILMNVHTDTFIFLLQNLSFVIKRESQKVSVQTNPSFRISVLIIYTLKMALSFTVEKFSKSCEDTYNNVFETVLEIINCLAYLIWPNK